MFPSFSMPRENLQNVSYFRSWLSREGEKSGFSILSLQSITSMWKVIDGNYLLFVYWKGKLHLDNLELFQRITSRGLGFYHDLGAGLMTLNDTVGFFDF